MTCRQCSEADATECMLRHADNGYDHTGRCSCRCHGGLMEETILIADTGRVSVREDRIGQVLLGISHDRDVDAVPTIEMVLTERQMTTLAEELRYLAATAKARSVQRAQEAWMREDEVADESRNDRL